MQLLIKCIYMNSKTTEVMSNDNIKECHGGRRASGSCQKHYLPPVRWSFVMQRMLLPGRTTMASSEKSWKSKYIKTHTKIRDQTQVERTIPTALNIRILKQKLSRFGHIAQSKESLEIEIMDMLEGSRKWGAPDYHWLNWERRCSFDMTGGSWPCESSEVGFVLTEHERIRLPCMKNRASKAPAILLNRLLVVA